MGIVNLANLQRRMETAIKHTGYPDFDEMAQALVDSKALPDFSHIHPNQGESSKTLWGYNTY